VLDREPEEEAGVQASGGPDAEVDAAPSPDGLGTSQSKPPALERSLEAEGHVSLPWKTIVKRGVTVVIGGLAIYLVLPAITEVLASWPSLRTLQPAWFALALLFQVAHFICTFALQRVALRTKRWFPVVTAALAGNAITDIVPAGDVPGAALQFRMLETAGLDAGVAIGGLTAFSLLGIGSLLALPILTLPIIVFGAPISRGLVEVALLGIAAFVLFAGFCAILLTTDRLLAWLGRVSQRVYNRFARHHPKIEGLDNRLLRERDTIMGVLGHHWKKAALLTSARLGSDFLCLWAALRATGARPHPSLVLLAYTVTGILALVPLTPGGLGLVEAGLSGMLILAGVESSSAFLATLAYRLASYWLPLLAGPVAYGLFRLRYRRNGQSDAGVSRS
jgi:uncharacterized protein (TIRG00374 family)